MIPSHPFIVHLPLGLLAFSGVFYLLRFFINKSEIEVTAMWTLFGGTAGLVLALLTGELSAAELDAAPALKTLLDRHELLGYVSIWLFGMLATWAWFRKKNQAKTEKYLFSLAFWIALGILAWSAHLGGQMVYLFGAGVQG